MGNVAFGRFAALALMARKIGKRKAAAKGTGPCPAEFAV